MCLKIKTNKREKKVNQQARFPVLSFFTCLLCQNVFFTFNSTNKCKNKSIHSSETKYVKFSYYGVAQPQRTKWFMCFRKDICWNISSVLRKKLVSRTGLDKVSGHPVLWESYLTCSDPFFVGKEKECAVLEELPTKGSVTDGQCNTTGAIICAEARQILRGWIEKRVVINPVKVP